METEWTELVEHGWNSLVSLFAAEKVAETILDARGIEGKPGDPYGDGHASDRIAKFLQNSQDEGTFSELPVLGAVVNAQQ